MGFTLFQMIAMGMMHSVATGPAVIRDQQEAVENEAYRNLNLTVGVKGAVATFVSNDPTAHRHGACDNGIQNPDWSSPELQGNLRSRGVRHE